MNRSESNLGHRGGLWPTEYGDPNQVLQLITQVQDLVERAYRQGVEDAKKGKCA